MSLSVLSIISLQRVRTSNNFLARKFEIWRQTLCTKKVLSFLVPTHARLRLKRDTTVMASTTLFVYGSLMAEEVLQTLLGRVPKSVAATLDGYLRFSVHGKQYPIISKLQKEDKVKGRLLYEINPRELDVLDLFEGDEYVRTAIVAHAEEGNDRREIAAQTYVATKDTFDTLTPHLSNDWDYAHFRANHLESFLKMCEEFQESQKRVDIRVNPK